MRTFHLLRHEDVSGVSGTGPVAEGVMFSDGRCAVRWITGERHSTTLHDSLASVRDVHGHDGRTEIQFDKED